MKHFVKIASALALALAPALASAQINYNGDTYIPPITNANGLVTRLASLGDVAVYLLIALAVLWIVYSTVRYFIMGKEGDEARKEAGMNIFYVIIGLFVIVSIWGLVALLINTFPTQNQIPGNLPSANFVKP